jgi:hypothetical protein
VARFWIIDTWGKLFWKFGSFELKPISPKLKSSLLRKWDLF